MLNLISIILIVCIIVFLLTYKRTIISKLFINKKILRKDTATINFRNNSSKCNDLNTSELQTELKIYSNNEKAYLKKEMFYLFNGNKEQKLKALEIARNLSDKSTLKILRIGLKDMDSEIVKISAELISKFKK